MPIRRMLGVVCALVLLAAIACQGDDPEESATHGCSDDADCKPTQLCVFGLCSDSCATIDDCKNGAVCLDTGRGSACARLQDNACVSTADCPANTRCVAGRCQSDCESGGNACPTGQTCRDGKCVGSRSPDGGAEQALSSGAGAPAAGAARGSAGTSGSAAMSCAPGSVRCDGNWVVRCEEDGTTIAEETCAFVCLDGACSGSCTPRTQRCFGQERQRCDDAGTWQTLDTCAKFCTPSACADTCPEGSRQCDGSTVLRCASGQLVEDTVCGFVCDAGACSGQCLPGSRRCAEGAASSCGADGMWTTPTACADACVEGACTGMCIAGERRCAGTGGYQICTELGQWGASQACNGACILGNCTGVCSPGAARCDTPSSTQLCEATGQWGASKACGAGGTCTQGHCGGSCTAGAVRCDPSGAARLQTCSTQGMWQPGTTCSSGSCRDGKCATSSGTAGTSGTMSVCTPSSRRCDPSDAKRYQVCSAQGAWAAGQACPQNASCSGLGECPAATSCVAGQSPDWYSSAQAGGDPSLDDLRWGNAPLADFESTFGFKTGGYYLVFDRAAGQLALSIRVTMGPAEAPLPDDYVYFGISLNGPGAATARSVVIPLIEVLGGEGPVAIANLETSVYSSGTWQSETASWVQHASVWRGGPNDGVSWAVSMRADLAALGVDASKPFRIALAVHAAGATGDLTTPTSAGMLTNTPGSWALAEPSPACVGRVTLKP